MKYSYQNDQVTLCNKEVCLKVRGDNAQVISSIFAAVAFIVGVSIVAKALN